MKLIDNGVFSFQGDIFRMGKEFGVGDFVYSQGVIDFYILVLVYFMYQVV